MSTNGQVLASIVAKVTPTIRAISDEVGQRKPDPKRWSKKEILGHLIDSACNNHRRFVIVNDQEHLIFEGYLQEEWVASQNYQSSNWELMVTLWESYNLHLADVVDKLPEATLLKVHRSHCLDKMAWKRIPSTEPATLDYLIKDYIGHLEHHVRQILPDYAPVMMGTYEFQAEQ